MEHLHFVGIGGAGLSAIAQVLIEKGYTISGSDRQHSAATEALERAGARVTYGHASNHITGASRLICSSAIPDDNPEILAARAASIPVLKRADFLPELLRGHQVIAVAGTHGKTTTTAMIAWILKSGDYDPSYIIGSIANNLGGNAHAGTGPHFVIEADEYDRMFHGIQAHTAIITNIEHDHPDCYPTPDDYLEAFLTFSKLTRPDGRLIINLDDPACTQLASKVDPQLRQTTYAIHALQAEFSIRNHQVLAGQGMQFDVTKDGSHLTHIAMQVPGMHNVSNALAACTATSMLDVPVEVVTHALETFSGTERRFQITGERAGITVVDDYAHHPTEIGATIAAARSRYPAASLWVVWQPHTYSRTRRLHDDYLDAFIQADHVIILPIYAAREPAPTDGFSARWLSDAMDHKDVSYVDDFESAVATLFHRVKTGDVVMVLSAGDATLISKSILERLNQRERQNYVG
jgi:UDP-N-acetylmuramate--alanine ligase